MDSKLYSDFVRAVSGMLQAEQARLILDIIHDNLKKSDRMTIFIRELDTDKCPIVVFAMHGEAAVMYEAPLREWMHMNGGGVSEEKNFTKKDIFDEPDDLRRH